ncbi:putative peptide modification system cyclase [Stenotrophomonas sp. 24(2023)]|uniref:putative peptide modification system cyclase n=1 Tax=Stenotrophomonas sp. 24(2023) TaxID=3068324 RepID=UPI0027DEC53A|nr:putative peptide modification system cyclase [Stenotrophomonas sp. 24(2023)]WMJ71274.1 putative peptide modification system cyclase [Stenotrophomonas sp. 24(2023)]
MNGDTGTSTPHTTQLRALLFTDLCDSTLLVERMGDAAAAELFQDHDRLVVALQQRWNGQQIDRSDGLFMLFERPVDALGFALDYQRGLQALGSRRTLLLRARAGLHVGEVLLWNNSAESIALGAKPLEVEGLAKPMAARLMQLARPGQLLVSAAVESMVRRAVDALGEAGHGLKWRSFGRWRFKGVAQSMEVFGVHAADSDMPSRPRGSAKAVRAMPWWRRPMVMTAQATLVIALVAGAWLLARPAPAIAFAERDWVVLGDVRNGTGEAVFDASLRQALLVGLEQSRHINVLAEGKISESLEMARVPGDSPLDLKMAVDVANREGARAVLMPSVVNRAGGYDIAVDVVDPATAQVVTRYAAHADARDGAIAAAGTVVEKLRGGLGESMAGLSASLPLPMASTHNLRALRAYALAERALSKRRFDEALQLYQSAVELDPEFALAYTSIARHYARVSDRAEARRYLDKALALAPRLPHRERLYVRGWQAELEPGGWPLDTWRVLAGMYPDSFAGLSNTAWYLVLDNRFAEAEPFARGASVPQDHLRSWPMVMVGRIQLARNDAEGALATLREVASLRGIGADDSEVDVLVALRRYAQAGQMLDSLGEGRDDLQKLMFLRARMLLAADRGDCSAMRAAVRADTLRPVLVDYQIQRQLMHATVASLCEAGSGQQLAGLGTQLQALLADRDHPNLADRTLQLLAVAYLAQRDGQPALAAKLLRDNAAVLRAQKSPVTQHRLRVVQAMDALGRGDADGALRILAPILDGSEPFQAHVVMLHAHQARNDPAGVKQQQEWLTRHRGLAIAEVPAMQVWQPLNVHDVATWGAPWSAPGSP